MRVVSLINEIYRKEIPMDQQDRTDLENDLKNEWNKIPYSETILKEYEEKGEQPPVKVRAKVFLESVWARLLFPVVYLWAISLIREIKNPTPEGYEEIEGNDSAMKF